jgi:hypothetical protein
MKKDYNSSDSRDSLRNARVLVLLACFFLTMVIPAITKAQGVVTSEPSWNAEKIIHIEQAGKVIIHIDNAVAGQKYKLKNLSDGSIVQTIVASGKTIVFDPLKFSSITPGTTQKFEVYDIDLNLEVKFSVTVKK